MSRTPTTDDLAHEVEKLRAELATLEQREAHYRALFENSLVGMGVASMDGRFLAFNDAILQPGGYTRADIEEIGNVAALYYDLSERHELLGLARQQGYLEPTEVRFKRKDGTPYDALMSLRRVEFGGQDAWLATVEDISARKQAEATLRESRERLHSVVTNTPIVLWALDCEGVFTLSEGKGLEALSLKPGQVVGTSVFDLYRDMPTILEANRRALAGEELSNLVHVDHVSFDAHYIPLKDASGNVTGMVGVAVDVTGRVRAEEALRKLNTELEQRVAERTAELEAAIEELTTLTRLKDVFVANISHELRTPIASLRLYHELLISRPDKATDYLRTLQRETDRLARIVEGLLALSRLDQGEVELELSAVDLNALVAAYVTDRPLLADSRGLALELEQQPDLPLVQADEGLLGQVLSILLTNAINYTPRGGRLVVRTHAKNEKGEQWTGFSVSDTGLGIPDNERDRLFERFFRGKVGRESGEAGTGLGLAIAKGIVERHAGRIEVESVEGAGTTFRVMLPTTG